MFTKIPLPRSWFSIDFLFSSQLWWCQCQPKNKRTHSSRGQREAYDSAFVWNIFTHHSMRPRPAASGRVFDIIRRGTVYTLAGSGFWFRCFRRFLFKLLHLSGRFFRTLGLFNTTHSPEWGGKKLEWSKIRTKNSWAKWEMRMKMKNPSSLNDRKIFFIRCCLFPRVLAQIQPRR